MNRTIVKIVFLISLFCFFSCVPSISQLSHEEKEFNPYSKGETLIFQSTDNKLDSISIVNIKSSYPDGLGVSEYNEFYKILSELRKPINGYIHKYPLVTLVASTADMPSYFVFQIRIDDIRYESKKYPLKEILALNKDQLTVTYGTLDDVIILEDNRQYPILSPKGIIKSYWSLSKGLVRFECRNGTIWELYEIHKS